MSREYVELTAAELASPELVAALHEETEGNPLFVTETVRLLALEGLERGAAETEIAIPQSVRDVIARRLSHLSEECNRVLDAGLGARPRVRARTRSLAIGRRLRGRAARDARRGDDRPRRHRRPRRPGRLRFAHVLIRDTLYEGLHDARRVRLHRLAVEALETLYGDEPGPHLAELAYHSIAGSDFDKALGYARRAGDRALALLAYEEAARLYETALDALDLTAARTRRARCELLLSLGEAADSRAGNTPAAKEDVSSRPPISRDASGSPRELARAAAGYGGRIVWARAGGDERLVPLLEEGAGGARRGGRRASRQAARSTRRSAARRALARPPRRAQPRGGRARPPGRRSLRRSPTRSTAARRDHRARHG